MRLMKGERFFKNLYMSLLKESKFANMFVYTKYTYIFIYQDLVIKTISQQFKETFPCTVWARRSRTLCRSG